MNRRTRIRRAISAQHDGALEARRAARLEADLQHEPELRGEAEVLEQVDQALAAWDAPEPRAGFTNLVMAALPEPVPARASLWSRAWRPTMATATAFVALLVGGLVGGSFQPTAETITMAEVNTLAFDPLPAHSAPGQYVELMLQEAQ